MEDKNIKRAKIMKECREKKGLTLQKVSELLKKYNTSVSSATLQRYETGEISRIPLNRINALAEIYGTTPSHLLDLETTPSKSIVGISMLTEIKGMVDYKKTTYEKLIPIEIVEIPMYGKASAGNGYINFEQEIGSYTVPKNIYKKGIFAIRVSGDSMTGIDKSIPDGSTAVVDPELCTDPINLNNKVCVFEYNDETYIKQLIIDKQGIIRLRSFNPEYDDIIVLNEKLLLCKGRVIRTFVENQW